MQRPAQLPGIAANASTARAPAETGGRVPISAELWLLYARALHLSGRFDVSQKVPVGMLACIRTHAHTHTHTRCCDTHTHTRAHTHKVLRSAVGSDLMCAESLADAAAAASIAALLVP